MAGRQRGSSQENPMVCFTHKVRLQTSFRSPSGFKNNVCSSFKACLSLSHRAMLSTAVTALGEDIKAAFVSLCKKPLLLVSSHMLLQEKRIINSSQF